MLASRTNGEVGADKAELDEQVELCLSALDSWRRALLLGELVNGLPDGHPRAPGWIARALRELGEDDPLVRLSLRSLARWLRGSNSETFDRLWQRAVGSAIPPWATVDVQKIEWAKRWQSWDYSVGEAFLRANRHLLGADYDSAGDEVLIPVDAPRALALRHIRQQVAESPDAPATTARVFEVAEQFLEAVLSGRISLLDNSERELESDIIGQFLRAHGNSPRARAAVSLIELRRLGLDADIAAIAADDDLADQFLSRIAASHDAKVLRQASVVVFDHAVEVENPTVAVVASFFLGIGMVATEFAAQAREILAPVIAEAPLDRRAAWLKLSQRLAHDRP